MLIIKSSTWRLFRQYYVSSGLMILWPKSTLKMRIISIPILEQHQKLLKFIHKNCVYKFTALPNGYTEGPIKFTKALKPPLAQCRKNKIAVAVYFDGLITMACN